MDIRQSPQYAQYIKSLGWQVDRLGKWYVFIKKFPLIGSLIKIQRTDWPLSFAEIEALAQKYRAFQIIIEPANSRESAGGGKQSFQPLKSPFVPTKTLVKDLKPSEQAIFDSFSKNKRRDIRIAERNKMVVREGIVEDFIGLKKQYLLKKFILPIGTDREIRNIREAFGPKAKILVAEFKGQVVAGTLLLFYDKAAYYWQAAATDQGKKLLAPTLLLWEAMKLAKKMGCTKFDFEGIFDERFPKNKSWLGFTHFKEGFRGEEVLYPSPLVLNRLPFL